MLSTVVPAPDALFGTKGVEYLLVIAFLLALALFWRWLTSGPGLEAGSLPAVPAIAGSGWFRLPPDLFYHPGHAWARPESKARVRVGLDDFAQKLLGRADTLQLPAVGECVEQGGRGWALRFGDRAIEMLAPISGTVVARNERVAGAPQLLDRDPYGESWLLEIETSRSAPELRNLLKGDGARAWMDQSEQSLRKRLGTSVGPVLQDGGVPVSAIAKALAPEDWEELAREFLGTA
jgi:glycine cleavage system H lipoate-binding protein